MVCVLVRLLVDARVFLSEWSASDVLSSEEPSVDGPGAWSNHRQRAAEDDQHERHPNLASACEDNPELDGDNQRSYQGSPQPRQDEYPQNSSGGFRYRQASPRGAQLHNAVMEKSDSCEEPLDEKASSGPAIREC
jgi:hypothetical protein